MEPYFAGRQGHHVKGRCSCTPCPPGLSSTSCFHTSLVRKPRPAPFSHMWKEAGPSLSVPFLMTAVQHILKSCLYLKLKFYFFIAFPKLEELSIYGWKTFKKTMNIKMCSHILLYHLYTVNLFVATMRYKTIVYYIGRHHIIYCCFKSLLE